MNGANRPVTQRAGNEDVLANRQPRLRPRLDNFANGFVTGNQRVTHARKKRHASGEQQTLRAGADPAPTGLHDKVGTLRQVERKAARPQTARLLHHDCKPAQHG